MVIRAAALVLLMAGPAGAVTFDCGLTQAPDGKGLAGPLVISIDAGRGSATVADPMTRFYAGGPVPATVTRTEAGWRLDWTLAGVQGTGTAPAEVAYEATITGGDTEAARGLHLTARRKGAPAPAVARGTCWARPAR